MLRNKEEGRRKGSGCCARLWMDMSRDGDEWVASARSIFLFHST